MEYIYGSVQAGFDTPAEEESRYSVDMERFIMEHPTTSMLVTVKGESMLDAGIFPGDVVVVNQGKTPKIGDIIIAKVDAQYTLKYYAKTAEGNIYLQAGNKHFSDIYPEYELEIFGCVETIIRKL